ncbi:hypothetical protein OQA88_1944 [Cercophora sp. LCS_1]
MARRKRYESSDDELTISEPVRYEFESYNSDDDDADDEVPLFSHDLASHDVSQQPTPGLNFDDDEELPSAVVHRPNKRKNNGSSKRGANGRAGVRLVDVEVRIQQMSPARRLRYKRTVLSESPEPQSAPKHSPRRLRTRKQTSYDDYRLAQGEDFEDEQTKKRKRDDDTDFVGNDGEEDYVDDFNDSGDYDPNARRASRSGQNSRYASAEVEGRGSKGRSLRPRNSYRDEDRDELQDSDDDDDPEFFYVHSDIVRPGRPRKSRKLAMKKASQRGRASGGIEFEARRSSRANKHTSNMALDQDYDDDEIFYIDEEKAPAAPRVVGIREIFQQPSTDFKEVHSTTCDTCGNGENYNKGALVPCQGCSIVQHKVCLNTRSIREQCVTKVAPDSFVMQCRFCVCVHKKKDARAPDQATCQACHRNGQSCAAFSQKKTPKQEERLRKENGGVDPVTPVDPNLVNNPDNVLFRCAKCHRGWHYEHLPHPRKFRDPALDDPANLRKYRMEEYQITWQCKECQDYEEHKMQTLVAWRPVNRSIYTPGQTIDDFAEDQIEYLVKWQDKSHNHDAWMPGPWVYGTAAGAMRKAFYKRTHGESLDPTEDTIDGSSTDSLMRWTEKEAIHESWITPDIILSVMHSPRNRDLENRYKNKSRDAKFEEDMDRVLSVHRIYVKFEGLSYDEVVWDTPPDPESGHLWDAFLDAYREYLNGKHFQGDTYKVMKERIEDFRAKDFNKEIQVTQQPAGLQRGQLMAYQLEGLNWMLYNFRHERNVILADEMGLGKTVQVVALLTSFIQDSPRIWPFLVIVPNATCANWRREIKKWAPSLRVVAYYGGKVSQTLAYDFELFPGGSRELKAHVVIMSYDSAKDPETKTKFNSIKWAGMVIDEAQALKNDENGLYKALKGMNVPFKLLLTGTPLQNNKRELFNLLQFIDPKIKAAELDEQFQNITKENLPELHKMIRPYFLRRTKAGVLNFLPTMAQIIIPVSMSVLQERVCKSIMERNPDLIRAILARGKLKNSERGSLSNILMQLRKALCHPFVYSSAIEDRSVSPDKAGRNLIEASSKLTLLEVMLPKLKERGHRVLMFSQFLEELTILEDFLTLMGMRYERLDGSQSSLEKQKRIDAFNMPDSKLFAMLLSTRAGGVGINLATADTVIILDPDWNPHQDIQALSRAHRIGQKKKVLCFQLMTVDSAEEKILQIGRKKMALDHLLIESMDDKDGENINDVESVLKHGAAALFGTDKKKDAIKYSAADIDKLLDRSAGEETKQDGDKSAESAFAFARIWAQDKGGELADDLDVDEKTIDANVWSEIIQQRDEEARKERELQQETLGRGGRRRGTTNYATQKLDLGDDHDGGFESEQSGDEEFMGGAAESDGESEGDDPFQVYYFQVYFPVFFQVLQVYFQAGRSSDTQGGKETNCHKNWQLTHYPDNSDNNGDQAADRKPSKAANGDRQANDAVNLQDRSESHPQGHSQGQGEAHQKGGSKARSQGQNHTAQSSRGSTPASSKAIGKQPREVGRPVGVWPEPLTPRQSGSNGVGHVPQSHSHAHVQFKQPSNPTVVQPRPQLVIGLPPAPAPVIIQPQDVTAALNQEIQLTMQRLLQGPCLVCGFLHPIRWECPEMANEVNIRLALDRLRSAPGKTQLEYQTKRQFLLEKLVKAQCKVQARQA